LAGPGGLIETRTVVSVIESVMSVLSGCPSWWLGCTAQCTQVAGCLTWPLVTCTLRCTAVKGGC
jgi:hypothetical protein